MPHWTHYVPEKTKAMRSTRQRRPNFVSIQTKVVIKTPMISKNFLKAKHTLSIGPASPTGISQLFNSQSQIFSATCGLAIISRWHYSMLIDKLVFLAKVSGVYEIFNMENTWKHRVLEWLVGKLCLDETIINHACIFWLVPYCVKSIRQNSQDLSLGKWTWTFQWTCSKWIKVKVIPTDSGSTAMWLGVSWLPPKASGVAPNPTLQASSETKHYQKKGGKEEQKHQPLWQPEKKCWILMMSRNSSDETWNIIGVANWFFKTINHIWIL